MTSYIDGLKYHRVRDRLMKSLAMKLLHHLIQISVLSLILVYLLQFLNQFQLQCVCSSVFVRDNRCVTTDITTNYTHNNSEYTIYSNTNICVPNLTAREGDQRFKYNANNGVTSSSLYDNVQRRSLNPPYFIIFDDDVTDNNNLSSCVIGFGLSVIKFWYDLENIINTYIILPITKLIIRINCDTFERLRQIPFNEHPKHISLLLIYYWISSYRSVEDLCKKVRVLMCRQLMFRHDFYIALYNILQLSSVIPIYSIIKNNRFVLNINAIHRNLNTDDVTHIEYKPYVCRPRLSRHVGGGVQTRVFLYHTLQDYVETSESTKYKAETEFIFIAHHQESNLIIDNTEYITGIIPLNVFLPKLSIRDIRSICKIHKIHVPYKFDSNIINDVVNDHHCNACETYVTVFSRRVTQDKTAKNKQYYHNAKKQKSKKKTNNVGRNGSKKNKMRSTKPINNNTNSLAKKKRSKDSKRINKINIECAEDINDQHTPNIEFPPDPPSKKLQEEIAVGCCEEMSPKNIKECGCAVCGQLVQFKYMKRLSATKCDLNILTRCGEGITRQERLCKSDPIAEIKGPVLDTSCSNICSECENDLLQKKTPRYSLAKGLWIGMIPKQLQDLTFIEKLLIARVRHNKCIVRVSSGMHKMLCNAVMFENPTPKIYQTLPPSIDDLDDVLAFIYTGPCKPTEKDMERTPLLVRRRKIVSALEWLQLNHVDYYDINISYKHLEQYPENGIPVVIAYREAVSNKEPEATSAYDNEEEDGVEDGPCPFVVNGITGEQLEIHSPKTLIARAMKHLTEDKGGVLAISHDKKMQSIFNNPQLYPMMFPHLFPYGLGGIGSINKDKMRISDIMHKRRLIMYHDKRFQTDPYFPLIAFNHEQIKCSSTGGYLLTKKKNFRSVSDRLMNIDIEVVSDIADRLSKGERVKPVTNEEKKCFQLIYDLDHVAGHVQGSVTSKKYLRNEVWSMISYLGAPSWFITFAPADVNNPICLYYADNKENFSPNIRLPKECYRLIANNPVAGARFFHFIVEMFIKHILGVGSSHSGLYGNTAGYYGTVEPQGRLTLHLHMLLWIRGCLTPQEIRDRIMDEN
jgi:hypothetical protein